MSNIAIIPARGGSKRIPRKNIRPFLGKPIIAYAIDVAIKSQMFDEIMVSTEDDEIAEVAKQYGAKAPFRRSQKNADDFASTAAVLIEVLGTYQTLGQGFDFGCCLYPTAPFISVELIQQGYKMLIEGSYDSVFPVLRYLYPIQRALKIENDKVSMIWPEHYDARSQDLQPAYHDAGQFYWFSVPEFLKNQNLWTANSGALIIPAMNAQDIDTLEDWENAEFKYSFLKKRGQN